jgi:mitochondrial fission protein ELM1
MTSFANGLCWVVTSENLIGTKNQCVALAQAAGFTDPIIKTIGLKKPWVWFTPYLRHFSPAALTDGSSPLTAPWPDLLIVGGRKSIAAGLWVKRQSGGKTKLIVVLSPIVKDKNFDLVVVPWHDQYFAPNALTMTGALSNVIPDKLAAGRAQFPHLADLPQPRIAVLIGGTSSTHQFTPAVAERLTIQLKGLQKQNYGLMITASRRTPAALSEQMQRDLQHPHTDFWDGTGDNPFQAYLAYSDVIVVTEDSVSMACEAISTGKPVYIIKLEGGSTRFKRFHDYIVDKGYARWFEGEIDGWTYTPPDDLAAAAARVKMLLQN